MPITRTPIHDDDGSGHTGTPIDNAWKQEFYNQIDAAFEPVTTGFAIVDASGAGLVFGSGTVAVAYRIGKLMHVQATVIYPTTANGAVAKLGGLPSPASTVCGSGFYSSYGTNNLFNVSAGANVIQIFNAATSVPRTNAEMSGALFVITGAYLIT